MASIEYFGKTDLVFLINLINTELSKYVKTVSGKGLSTEDFTTALKTKLEGIDLSKYSTTEAMTKAISDAVKEITGIKFEKVSSLPTTGKVGVIYLVAKTTPGTDNVYSEYYWDDTTNKFELLGDTTVDLTGYVKSTDLKEITSDDVLAAWNAKFTE